MDAVGIVDIITIGSSLVTLATIAAHVWHIGRKIESQLDKLNDTNVRARRIEISQRINADKGTGKDFETISRLYDEYKQTGANSYIDDIYNDYRLSFKIDGHTTT
jgi:hypothetical protein